MTKFSNEISHISKEIIGRKAKMELLTHQINKTKRSLSIWEKKHTDSIQARALLQDVAKETQQYLEKHITKMVNSALQCVFDDPPEFFAKFVKRRNKTECDLLFVKDGEELPIMKSYGGGVLDVASIALRISFWSIGGTSPILILDEPGKFVSPGLQNKVSKMFKLISKKLGVQFIIISHQADMLEAADKIFKVKQGDCFEN